MKKSPLTVILLGVLAVSAVASVIFCLLYLLNTRQMHRFQAQAAMLQYRQTLINSLATDAIEYGKKNSAINPILESALGTKPAQAAPATPVAKPATK